MKRCSVCEEKFVWDEDVVLINNKAYHRDCVTLYPDGYVAFVDDEFLGGTENDDGELAFIALDEGEYIEEEDN